MVERIEVRDKERKDKIVQQLQGIQIYMETMEITLVRVVD